MKNPGIITAGAYILLGILIGSLFNEFRPDGIPWTAPPLLQVEASEPSVNPDSLAGIHLINLKQAKAYFDQGLPFIDAREVEDFEQGHISGAFASNNFMELIFRLDTLQTRDDLLITYCDDAECGLSKNLAYDLQASGFTHILVFEGGWQLWLDAGYPVTDEQ
ncbi:MAG: rhodanese-like domain-containing protein [Fidelibacterota bacterium]